jgi:hypothetical protein
LPETPMLRTVVNMCRKQCEQLAEQRLIASHRLTPALLIAKGFRSVTANTYKLKFQGRCVVSTILIILLAVVVVAFWVFDALHS